MTPDSSPALLQQQQHPKQQPRKRPIAPPFTPPFTPPLKGPSPVAQGVGSSVSRPFPGIREAPTFEPTAEEWGDPLAYIAALPPSAAAAGIVKIRPPRSWSPPCVLNPKSFWFKTRFQTLASLNGSSRSIQNYHDQLVQFHAQAAGGQVPLDMGSIYIGGRPIDWFHLRNQVKSLGGPHRVSRKGLWPRVGVLMRLAKSESEESLGLALKAAYEKTLQPFEEFLASEDKTTAFLTASNNEREHCTGVNAICVVCYRDEDEAAMLLCDGCNRGFHTYCLRPALATIPTCEWFCVQCLRAQGGDFGFEDAQDEHCLAGFQELARNFKEKYLPRCGTPLLSEAATEREFWKQVEAPPSAECPDVEVQYGADLHSTIHGSGFPTKETHPLDSYAICPWNLNNIPILKDSLLRHTSRDVSGMMVPWLYVGMVFSAFCWHTEDHFTYSINYLHWGETKTWYGVPASDADAFEATMRSQMPDLFEANPDLLFHLTTTLSPAILLDHGVLVTRLDQRPGDIVITFPRAYHAGFNHGFNFAEAVNFALPDWLSFGRACTDLYKEYKKAPVFSHDALVIAAIRERQMSMKDIHHFIADLCVMKRRSREIRQKARMSIDCLQIVSAAQLSSVPQCHDCHIFSFTEAFSCSCSPQKIACIQHLKGLCSCEPQMIILSERLSDSDFDFLSESMTAQKIKADHWKNGLRLTLQRPTPPSLETLRGLLRLGETLPVIPCEVLDLGLFVTKATQWVVSASKVLTRKLRKTDISPLLSLATDIFGQEKEWNAIILLLEKGTSLSVDIPEYHQLSQFVARGSKLRLRLRGLLNFDRRLPLIEYENAFVDIMELEIGFPEIPALAQHIHFLRWRTQVSALLQHERPRHKDMVNLIHRARQSNYFSSDSCFTELLALEHEVEMWRQNVRTFMEQNSSAKQTYQALTALILRGRQLPSPDGVMSKLEGMEERFQLWLRHAGEILELDSNGRLLLKKDCSIDMTEFELILQSAEQLEVRVEFGDFSRQRKAVDRWRTFGKRVLRRQHYTQSFADMVAYLAYNVRCCTTYIHDADRYCICRQLDGDGSIMIECDDCRQWYHPACLALSKKELNSDRDYHCSICTVSFHNLKTDAKQPYFEELEDLLNESKTLVLIPDEVVLLRNLVDDISFFRKKIRAFLASDPTDLITIKNFLRCAEGLQVILTPDLDRLRVKVTTFLSEEEKTKKWCVCQTLYDESRPMIACDECDEWFHWSCMNLSPVVAQQMETFICSACLDQTVMLKVPAIQAVSDEQHPNKKLKPQENSVDI